MSREIRSPGAGKVLELSVVVGAVVAEGDELVVLESMKMEIPVVAPQAGTVTAVHVDLGSQVQERALLVTLC
jgi:biotin carboxyl carrier protein